MVEHLDVGPRLERVDTVFGRHAVERPDRMAVHDTDGSVTYGQLWQEALDLAAALRDQGVRPGDPVALLGYGSRDSILGMLGVLAAGAHFVPLDPHFPAERLTWMLRRCGAALVLCCDGHLPTTDLGVPVRHVRQVAAAGEGAAGAPVGAAPGGPDSLAYVIFTSGSTGEPKAVGVPHRAVTGLALRPSELRCTADDGVLVRSTLVFDSSVLEIWNALLVGGSVLCAPSPFTALHETAQLVRDPRVTVAHLTPVIFALMVDHHLDSLGTVRLLGCGGDVMPAEQAGRMRDRFPGVRLVNTYGPTEVGVVSTVFALADWDAGESPSVPIGRPIAQTRCYVLDDRWSPVPPGEVGELFLGGDRLAIGYLGSPGLTAQRFLPDPFAVEQGARMYRTGDRVRVLADGTLQFGGRQDNEVKIRGYRVNLAEAEATLVADPQVAAAVVIAVPADNDRVLVGFVQPAAAGLDPGEVRSRAWTRAPRHVVPETILTVDAFPIGPTGKVDRQALLDRWEQGRASGPATVDQDLDSDTATIAKLWRTRAGAGPTTDRDFFSDGGSSLGLIQLVEDISAAFQVDLDFAEVYGLRSFAELVTLVKDSRQHQLEGKRS